MKKTLQVRQQMFWNELLQYEGKYDRQMLLAFFYYWAEKVTGRRKMLMELETSWDTKHRLALWSQRSFNKNDEAAAIRLERAKKSGGRTAAHPNAENAAEQKAIAAEREAEMEEARKNSISMEEYIKANPNSSLAKMGLKKQ